MNKLKQWLDTSSTDEKKALAAKAKTTIGSLRNFAGEYRPYQMKAGTARRVELAAEALRKKNPKLPSLTRADLCADCAKCEYAKEHAKNLKK